MKAKFALIICLLMIVVSVAGCSPFESGQKVRVIGVGTEGYVIFRKPTYTTIRYKDNIGAVHTEDFYNEELEPIE